MPDVSVLNVLLYGKQIGTLTLLQGERTLFAFEEFLYCGYKSPDAQSVVQGLPEGT